MDNNQDFRNTRPEGYRSPNSTVVKKRESRAVWIALGVIGAGALIGLVALDRSETSPAAYQSSEAPYTATTEASSPMPPTDVEPATGTETVPLATTSSAAPASDTPVETLAPLEPKQSATNSSGVVQSYASEEECKNSTGKPCHYVTCDSVPGGKQPDEVCGPNFQKGWQSVVPAPDKAAVPEQMAPPLSGQQNGPVDSNPPLTGQ